MEWTENEKHSFFIKDYGIILKLRSLNFFFIESRNEQITHGICMTTNGINTNFKVQQQIQ